MLDIRRHFRRDASFDAAIAITRHYFIAASRFSFSLPLYFSICRRFSFAILPLIFAEFSFFAIFHIDTPGCRFRYFR